jgi:segregation and condensation protein A
MNYTIKLPQFEGPFDLLLFFIERDELDIYNIPIATITNDFLEYIYSMERLNIDVASEFILVASSLMRIKAKMLLPRRELDEQGNEIDPREELVQRLMEYKQFKEIIGDLKNLEEDRLTKSTRGNVNNELKKLANKALIDTELESLSLFKLLKTFERVLKRMEEANKDNRHTVIRYNFTVKKEQKRIISVVEQLKKASCQQVFESCKSKMQAIFRFLALLELIQSNHVNLIIREGINNFWLE